MTKSILDESLGLVYHSITEQLAQYEIECGDGIDDYVDAFWTVGAYRWNKGDTKQAVQDVSDALEMVNQIRAEK